LKKGGGKMRRGRVVVLVALCLALALVYIPGVVNAKTITMKLGHYAAPGHPADRAANMFAENEIGRAHV